MERKKYVAKQVGKSLQEVDNYPIACVGDNYEQHCTPDQIAQAAKVVFAQIGLKPKVLAFLDYEILRGKDPVIVREKDPTSYLMRRNFATQMAIIGMNESEIQFLLGHDITDAYETRNEMVNFDTLKHRGRKMKERALFHQGIPHKDLSGMGYNMEYTLRDISKINLSIDLAPDDILSVRIESEEPRSRLNNHLYPSEGCEVQKKEYVRQPEYREDRTINILNEYHNIYSKYSKD